MKKITFLLLSALTFLYASAQKLPQLQQVSLRAPANAKADGKNLAVGDLKKYATSLGLGSSFEQCLNNNDTLSAVKADFGEGSLSDVSGTPSFFINGENVVGAQPFAQFEQVIESKLK